MIAHLPERLRTARLQANLSQTVIADACGVTQPAVSRWETGVSNSLGCNEPDLASLDTIARLTHKPVGWFLRAESKPTEPVRITATDVAAEAHHGQELAIMLAGPDSDLYQKITVNASYLHRSLGVKLSYADWLEQQLESRPFVADQDYFIECNRHYWSLDVAKGLALLESTARGFAVWRALIQLQATYQTKPSGPTAQVVEPPTVTLTPEPQALTVTPKEFVEITSCCLKIAHQLGLEGDDAVRGADQATWQLTGWSPRQVMGIGV